MPTTKDQTKAVITYYFGHVKRERRHLYGVLISLPLTVLIHQFLPPLILANVLSRLGRHDFVAHDIWKSFGPELVLYAVLVLVGGVAFWRIVDFFDWRLEANIQRAIARQVFDHLLRQSAGFHADHFGGSLVSQTNKLLTSYVRLADTTVYQVFPLVCSLLFAIVILSRRAPLFVLVFSLFAVTYIVSAIFVTRPVRRLSAEHATRESEQTGYLSDGITNVMAIKSFAGHSFEQAMFGEVTGRTRRSLLDLMRAFNRQQLYFTSVTNTIMAMSLLLGVISVVMFDANIGTVFLILNYTASIVGQLFVFSNSSLRNYNRAFGDASDMVSILALDPEVKDPAKPEIVRIKRGSIHFDHVTFSHIEGGSEPDDALFENLNLRIKAGEKIGLVGRSGSGKTTLTRILLRFSDINDGAITIDGQNIAHIRQDDLRDNIAYVPQEPLLFHRSLSDNIRYGRSDATDDAVVEAAQLAHADDFIRSLPEGYNTLVGERGIKLSGGQRQRVAIARALLKDAPVLLLDEATSALDSESELLIQDALWKLMEGRTAIVVAHRLSTIQKLDRIIVLDNGEILEQGSHQELLKQNGLYAKLWSHQSGGFMEE